MLPPSHTCLSPAPCIYVDFSSLLETRPLDRAHTHYRLILSWYLSHTHSLCLCHTCTPSSSTRPLSHTHGLFATTSKMPMRCTEHQDAFVWVVYLVGEKDERGKALFANVERGVGIFLQNCQFPSYPSDIDRTTYIAGWQAHHHHQLYFLSLLL